MNEHTPTVMLATKLAPPHLPACLIVRERVNRRFSDALQRPLVVVSAPAGFGKTTALAQWLSASALPVAWVSLDEGDNDPVRFWTYVLAASDRLVPGIFQKLAPLALDARQHPPERLLATLVDALVAAPHPAVLVLDDYQALREDNVAIHDALAFLVERAPEQLHLVLVTRSDPPLPLWHWRVRDTVAELRSAELRFSREEGVRLLSQSYGLSPSPEVMDLLDARLEGWVAGLQLIAHSLRGRNDNAAWAAELEGVNHHIFDYVAVEVLRGLPQQYLSFLLHTCILDRFHGPLCDAVTASSDGDSMLAELNKRNLFLIPLDNDGLWYHYHPLFADVLRRQVSTWQPALVPELYRRASAWHQAYGRNREAINYALVAGDYDRAAQLIETHAARVLSTGRWTSLRRWLERLPDAALRARPRLYLIYAFVLHGNKQFAAFQQCVRAARAARAQLPPEGVPSEPAAFDAELAALSAVASALEGAPPALCIPAYEGALARISVEHPFRRLLLLSLGIAHYLNGSLREAGAALQEVHRVSTTSGDIFYLARSAAYLGQVLMLQGRLRDTVAFCQRVATQLEDAGATRSSGGISAAVGMALFEQHELASAAEHLENGLAREDPIVLAVTEAHSLLAYVCEARGDPQQAHEVFADAWATLRQMGTWAPYTARISAHQARLYMVQGNLAAAAGWARAYEHRGDAARATAENYPLAVEWERIVLARLYVAEGKIREARALLAEALAAAEVAGRIRHVLEILIVQVLAGAAQGDIRAALQSLRRALTLGAREGFVQTFLAGGPAVCRLLMRLRSTRAHQQAGAGIDDANARSCFVETLLQAFNNQAYARTDGDSHKVASTPARVTPSRGRTRTAQQLIEPLTARELDVLRLLARGESNQEIAGELVIAIGTVKRHISNVLGKLSVESRTRAIDRAQTLHLLEEAPEALVQEPQEPAPPTRAAI